MSAGWTSDLTASQLREQFDRSFSEPERPPIAAPEPLLCIRIGGDPWAVRRNDVRRLVADRRVVPVPSTAPAMLGVLGLRGELVPVHSLRALLGYRLEPPSRWVIIAGSEAPLGLAFDFFEGQLRVPAPQLAPSATPPRPHVHAVIAIEGMPRSVLDLPSILELVTHGGRR
jgi:chemotaxis signal transduction protein